MSEQAGSRGGWIGILLASLAGIAVGALVVLLWQGRTADARVQQVVHNYILDNPEILPAAMEVLEQRQSAAAIGPRRAQFEAPYAGAWAGAADADVVLVEFFDYACGFCRASNAAVTRLLAEDPRLKVVWRDFPVLGPDSQQAALASLAAADQGRFRQYHDALFALGRPSAATIAQAQSRAGVRAGPATDAHRRELASNLALADGIRANGTPTYVVGDQVMHGAVGYDTLRAAVQRARGS